MKKGPNSPLEGREKKEVIHVMSGGWVIFGAVKAMTSVCIHSLSPSPEAPAAARRSAAASAGEARNARVLLLSRRRPFSDYAPRSLPPRVGFTAGRANKAAAQKGRDA